MLLLDRYRQYGYESMTSCILSKVIIAEPICTYNIYDSKTLYT